MIEKCSHHWAIPLYHFYDPVTGKTTSYGIGTMEVWQACSSCFEVRSSTTEEE